ncbi:MAG TPA: protein translocase subunit SecF [Bryobacteraceae bacterium]|jgi:preprotein translocase subunit SecF
MELFKNTDFDFLKWKWPFIIASLVVTGAGFISLAVKGGPHYGIDFKGGAQMRLRFTSEPPMDKIRKALDKSVPGSSLQQLNGTQEIEVVTPIKDEKELNANRQVMEDTLRSMFADSSGKLDVNNSSAETLAAALRPALQDAGVALSDAEVMDVATNIEKFRNDEKGGLLRSFDELSSVKGVTPQIIEALKKQCVLGPFTILSADVVGPKIGADLRRQAIEATMYALAAMLVYIWFRFEWIYGLAAVVAVFHDTLITIGLFSLFNKEISLSVVAALLTLVGYSMNDTIVVFDRIRENLKILRREKLERLINISVNQTLSRTVLTSGLTLITALSLWLFGGEVLNGFSFALVWGIIFGTYSSVFIASPILIFGQNLIDQRKARSASSRGAVKAPEIAPAAGLKTPSSKTPSLKTPGVKAPGVKPPAGKPAGGKEPARTGKG